MNQYLKKFISLIICFVLVLVVCFFLPRLLPGDPIAYLSGSDEESLSLEKYEEYRHILHLDEPLSAQFLYYLKDIASGSLGYSLRYEASVSSLIEGRLKNTLMIALPALCISSLLGLYLGLVCAEKKGKFLDKFFGALNTIVNALPMFVTGVVLLIIFAYKLKWLPYSGLSGIGVSKGDSGYLADRVLHLVLPVLTLAIAELPARFTLARMASQRVYSQKAVLFAKQRGLSKSRIRWCYVAPEILPEYIASIGAAFAGCIGGTVVIENIFSIRGIGTLLVSSSAVLDYQTLQGVLFVCIAIISIGIIVSDILCILASPRILKSANVKKKSLRRKTK